jgi:hypothetical protein
VEKFSAMEKIKNFNYNIPSIKGELNEIKNRDQKINSNDEYANLYA